MKPILIFLFALLTLESRAVAGLDTAIPQTNRVILSSGRWKPSGEQTQRALAAIQAFLEKQTATNDWKVREIKKILEHEKEYRVQFVGIERDGKKLIWCNFFPATGVFGANWKREKVMVMDGGFSFWQIEYDPNSGQCLNFSSNGYAKGPDKSPEAIAVAKMVQRMLNLPKPPAPDAADALALALAHAQGNSRYNLTPLKRI
jgi:hypothetical protein